MKVLHILLVIVSTILVGETIFAQTNNNASAQNDPSNPGPCSYTCTTQVTATVSRSTETLSCPSSDYSVDSLKNCTAYVTVTDGELTQSSDCDNPGSPITVTISSWSWDISDDGGFDPTTEGTYSVTSRGTGTPSDDRCDEVTVYCTFDVEVSPLQVTSPSTLTMCDTKPVKVSCGKVVDSVEYEPGSEDPIIEVIGKKVKGLKAGSASITVRTEDGEYLDHTITVQECTVTEKPAHIETTLIDLGGECKDVGGDAGFQIVYSYEVDYRYSQGKFVKCPDDGDSSSSSSSSSGSGDAQGEDFGVDEEYSWTKSGNLTIVEGTEDKKIVEFYVLGGGERDGSLTVDVDGSWEKCGESGDADSYKTESFSPEDEEEDPDDIEVDVTAFAPQNKYTGLDIHGKPKSATKPQQEKEEDSYKSDFNVDAYHLSPSFNSADISIPLQGTDLKLELRRTNSTDVTTSQSINVDNMPYRLIMGRTWRANIAPVIYKYSSSTTYSDTTAPTDECTPPGPQPDPHGESYWIAVDDGGGEFKYLGPNQLGEYQPFKKQFSDFGSALHKLTGTPGESFSFRKKNGMTFEYEPVNYSVGDATISHSSGAVSIVSLAQFHRAKSIMDRTGNKLNYIYDTATDLFPSRIEYDQNPQMFIELIYNDSNTRLEKVRDPLGREVEYVYSGGNLQKVIKTAAPVANPVNPKQTTVQTQEYNFTYGTKTIPAWKETPSRTTHYMASMTDPENNTISLDYYIYTEPQTFPDKPPRRHVLMNRLTTPDGTVTASIQVSGLIRTVTINDAAGDKWINTFFATKGTGSIGGANGLSNTAGSWQVLLNGFIRRQFLSENLSQEMFAKFKTDSKSTINLDYVRDYHGVEVQYDYGREPIFDEDGEEDGFTDGIKNVTYYRNGVQVTEAYNFGAHNQPYREILDPNGLSIVKEFGYEANTNQMVRIVDANGNVTTYDVDNQGNRLREIAPLGKVTKFTYDLGFQTSAVDGDGRKTVSKKIYHAAGWDLVSVQLLTYGDTRTYDQLAINIDTYQPDNTDDKLVTIKKFDLVGNLIQEIDANGNITDHVYDDTNFLQETLMPEVFDYDSQSMVRPSILFTRDKNRQTVGKRDARGNWTFTKYDSMLRPVETHVEVISENRIISSYVEYDSAGNKSRFTDPRGMVSTFQYDEFRNLTQEIKDVGGENLTSTYEYGVGSGNDVFGDTGFVPTKKVDPRGISTILKYDNAYRLTHTYRGEEHYEALLSRINYDDAGNVTRTLTYNNKIASMSGNYSSSSAAPLSGNQETRTYYDGLNRPRATAVDLNGNGASESDPADITTNTFYDTAGNKIITIDGEGHSQQTEYDAAGRVVKQVVNLDDNPNFGLVAGNYYTISASGDDIVTSKFYDDNGNCLTETLVNDTPGAVGEQSITKVYDAVNRVKGMTDPAGYSVSTKYDLNNNARAVTNARNFESITEYDELNRPVKQILPEVYDAESKQDNNPEIVTVYDDNNNVISKTDARSLTTVNEYDKLNRLEKTTQLLGAVGSPLNIISEFEYDNNNNQIQSTLYRDDETLVTSTTYDVLDRPLVTTDPEGFHTVVLCDLVGNKVQLFDKRSNLNENGTTSVTPKLRYSTDVLFDRANRTVRNTLPPIPVAERTVAGTIVVNEDDRPYSTIHYKKNNWIEKTIDLNGNQSQTFYDNAGRKTQVRNAIAQDIDYTYDKAGNILTQTVENNLASGGNQVTTYAYDKRNLLLTETLNKGHSTLEREYGYTYDENGNKKTRTFPNLAATTYNYDGMDRLIQEVYTESPDQNRTYEYNNNGAVVNCTDNTGKVAYEYDLLGRQLFERKFNTNNDEVSVVESVYDKANNRVRCYFPMSQKTLVSAYDKRNLLIQLDAYEGDVAPGSEPADSQQTTYTYNANGLQETCSLPNGQVTTKLYDFADRILTSETTNGTVNGYIAEYKRDAVGNQLQTLETRSSANTNTDKVRTLDFIYDDIYRLTHESDDVTGETVENVYLYDLQGNRLSRTQKDINENDQDTWTYTNDILNRTTVVRIDLKGFGNESSYVYQYDTNGNREYRTHLDKDNVEDTHVYAYDEENRLTAVTDDDGEIFTASYDYRTRRTLKSESVDGGDDTKTSYIYDGVVTCQEMRLTSGDEYDGSNALLDKQYIRGNGMGGGIGSVLYMERPADIAASSQGVQDFYNNLNGPTNSLVPEFYTYNAVGSVVANTDIDGYVIRENDFDAYGNIVREEDHTTDNFPDIFGGSKNDLLFSTKERDMSTGLDYFGFRYYDAVLGKFTTRDPSGYPDGPNNYLYVKNNPINHIDPLGLMAWYEGWGDTISNLASSAVESTIEAASNVIAVATGEVSVGAVATEVGSNAVAAYDAAVEKNVQRIETQIEAGASFAEAARDMVAMQVGEMVGVTQIAEGSMNVDSATGEKVGNGWDRAGKIAEGVSAMAGSLAGAANMSSKLATKVDDVKKGVIYKIDGKYTESGKPYIGSANDLEARIKSGHSTGGDGRLREHAKEIDTYDINNPAERRVKEQAAIDENGGVGNLDNKRNEISDKNREKYGLDKNPHPKEKTKSKNKEKPKPKPKPKKK